MEVSIKTTDIYDMVSQTKVILRHATKNQTSKIHKGIKYGCLWVHMHQSGIIWNMHSMLYIIHHSYRPRIWLKYGIWHIEIRNMFSHVKPCLPTSGAGQPQRITWTEVKICSISTSIITHFSACQTHHTSAINRVASLLSDYAIIFRYIIFICIVDPWPWARHEVGPSWQA